MDLSLDEIIKKNNVRKGTQGGRRQSGRGGLKKVPGGSSSKFPQSSLNRRGGNPPRRTTQNGVKSRVPFKTNSSSVIDARLKIIQKNRMRLSDAREKLAEIAKHSDARSKIRGKNQKTTQQFERGRPLRGRGRVNSGPRPNVNRNQGIIQRSIKNNVADLTDPSSLIRCTINRPVTDFSSPSPNLYPEDVDMEMPVLIRPHNDLSSIKIVTQNEYRPTYYEQEQFTQPMYMDHFDQPVFTRELQSTRGLMLNRRGGRMSQEMRARLDTPTKSVSPPSPPSQGHRIVVSNLQSSVTHEDIKELFEDIGPLVTSRLVRAGTAEVIYKFQKDARKAVDAYHNRQLDGQPMKCMLVNPRSPPTGSSGALRSNNIPVVPKFPSSSKSTVVPDLSAIHKALFTPK